MSNSPDCWARQGYRLPGHPVQRGCLACVARAAEVVMALPVPIRSDPYHGWLLRAFLAVVALLIFALALSKA